MQLTCSDLICSYMEAVVPLIETMVPPTVGSRPLAGSADGLKEKIALAGMSPSVVDARLRSSYSSDGQLNWGLPSLPRRTLKGHTMELMEVELWSGSS